MNDDLAKEIFERLKEAAQKAEAKRAEKEKRKPPQIYLPEKPLTDAEKFARDITPT